MTSINNAQGCQYCGRSGNAKDIIHHQYNGMEIFVWIEIDELRVLTDGYAYDSPSIEASERIRFCPMCGIDLRWYTK